MKKILTLNIKQLRTEESFGYQKQVVAETANLPIGSEEERPGGLSTMSATDSVLETKVSEFTTAVDAFDDALKASAVNPATATATPRSWRRRRKAACCTISCKTSKHWTQASEPPLPSMYGLPT